MTALIVVSNVHEIKIKDPSKLNHVMKGTIGQSENMTEWKVGFYPPSLVYPYKHLTSKGVDVHFCSPNGGKNAEVKVSSTFFGEISSR